MVKKVLKKLSSTKQLSKKEIDSLFEKLNTVPQSYPVQPEIDHTNPTSRWVTTAASSKQSNKIIKVSAWQTGQAF